MKLEELKRLCDEHEKYGWPKEHVEVRGLGVGDVKKLIAVAEAAHVAAFGMGGSMGPIIRLKEALKALEAP